MYNYLFLVLLGAFLAILIFNSFSKYRKSRLEFTVALSVLLIFYYLISICTYLVIIFDDLEKPALNLLIGSWACSGILIPTIVAFNIVYLVKTRDKKEEIKQVS